MSAMAELDAVIRGTSSTRSMSGPAPEPSPSRIAPANVGEPLAWTPMTFGHGQAVEIIWPDGYILRATARPRDRLTGKALWSVWGPGYRIAYGWGRTIGEARAAAEAFLELAADERSAIPTPTPNAGTKIAHDFR